MEDILDILDYALPIIIIVSWLAVIFWALFLREKKKEEPKQTIVPERTARSTPAVSYTEPPIPYGKIRKVEQIISSDRYLTGQMQRLAGLQGPPVTLYNRELISQLVKRLSDSAVDILHVGATQEDVDFDLRSGTERVRVEYPTRDIEPVQMTGIDQLTEILPEQMLLENDQFYDALARNELLVMQPFEYDHQQKLLYIAEDHSGSMRRYTMKNGLPRFVWAHGVSLNLALKAFRGLSKFARREFDLESHKLIQVNNSDDAEAMIIRLLTVFPPESAGTNIFGILTQAVKDINEMGKSKLGSDILLISDGEDPYLPGPDSIRALLGTDIRLHVVTIGASSELLKSVATSYREFL